MGRPSSHACALDSAAPNRATQTTLEKGGRPLRVSLCLFCLSLCGSLSRMAYGSAPCVCKCDATFLTY